MLNERPFERDLRQAMTNINEAALKTRKELPAEIVVKGLLEVAAHHLEDLVDEDQWDVFSLGNVRLCEAIDLTTRRADTEERQVKIMHGYDMRQLKP